MRKVLSIYALCVAFLCCAGTPGTVSAQGKKNITFSGTILDKKSGEPVEFATVVLSLTEQWAVADKDGRYTIKNVPAGKNIVSVSCLGYVTDTKEIILTGDVTNYKISLVLDNLSLEEVVVTAKDNSGNATTSRTIDKTALEHIQMVNVADVSALLPGGRTINPDLISSQTMSVRSESGEAGGASFGTAIEVDGVRIGNNASFSNLGTGSGLKGVTTNSIASSNVESVEVISGLPSVEYGDMGTGVVKINTRKGVTPWTVNLSTNPTMKQAAVSKGFDLGKSSSGLSRGVLNTSAEYTKAISDPRSPFTSYTRQTATLTYSNLLSKGAFADAPLKVTAGLTGNLGGLNSSADPDSFKDTWTIGRDDALRGNITLNWLLSNPWITNIELNASASYSNKLSRSNEMKSYAAATPALHGTQEGYFVARYYSEDPDAEIILIPRGTHYNTMALDDRPLNTKVAIKGNWAKNIGNLNNKLKVGADWTSDRNFGVGMYSEDLSTAESYRQYRYDLVPTMHNVAAYLEDNAIITIGKSRLNLVAGLRMDNSIIRGSVYGNTTALSPRLNAKYTVFSPKDRRQNTIKELAFRASWGIAVKQPSYSILYPEPTYRDIQTFVPTASSDGTAYYAYYIMPKTVNYNPQLRWQQNRQAEIGVETDIDGNRISLTAYCNRTLYPYMLSTGYDVFSYNYTDPKDLAACTIAADNRSFEVDGKTGIVTVHDKTGALGSQVLSYTTKKSFNPNTYADNGDDPVTRYGLEWVVDFKRIKSLNTSIRWDGSFYGFRNIDHKIIASCPYTNLSYDRSPFKYVGYYVGSNDTRNGSESRNLRTNLTINTNIPKVRMVFTVRVEAGLLKYNRFLSEGNDGKPRTYAISDKGDILSFTGADIYAGNQFLVTFPDKYASVDNPGEIRDYLTDLKWARDNDRNFYNDLSKLATVSSYLYYIDKEYISPYFSANFSVTKEIGDLASVSFYANNFFNNLGQVRSSKTGIWTSATSYIPKFFYGLSLRLKF